MRLLVVILIAFVALSVAPVSLETQINAASRTSEESKARIISKRQAINAAKRQVNGKVLSANLIQSKGPAVYRVKMLVSEKRVRTVFVDGKSGSVIRIN